MYLLVNSRGVFLLGGGEELYRKGPFLISHFALPLVFLRRLP